MTESFRDLSDLPKAKRTTDGEPPDTEARFGSVLVDAWHAEETERDKRFRGLDVAGIEGARFYHSNAGACSRLVAYAALGIPDSNPIDAPGHFITRLGREIHDWLQAALKAKYGDACEIEIKVNGDDMGGHIDVVIRLETGNTKPWVIALEIKSMGGFAYKLAIGDRGPAQGPKFEHKIQLALNAKRIDADEAVIVYVARDAVSIQGADRKGFSDMLRVVAEWTYTREQYEPLADKEIWRVGEILRLLDDEKMLPARKIPELARQHPRHTITNPLKGEWVETDHDNVAIDAGEWWACLYCRQKDMCARTGAHREPVSVLVDIGVLDAEAANGGSRGR